MSQYSMNWFIFPKNICNDLDNLNRYCFWNNNKVDDQYNGHQYINYFIPFWNHRNEVVFRNHKYNFVLVLEKARHVFNYTSHYNKKANIDPMSHYIGDKLYKPSFYMVQEKSSAIPIGCFTRWGCYQLTARVTIGCIISAKQPTGLATSNGKTTMR